MRLTSIAVLVGTAATAVACSSRTPAARILVDAPRALVDSPLTVTVDHLQRSQQVVLRLSAADNRGVTWHSSATFIASSQGVVALDTAASTGGSYVGVQPMGLWWSMKPGGGPADDTEFVYSPSGFTATLDAEVAGRTVASVGLQRSARASTVVTRDLRPADVGFYGEYFAAETGSVRHPAVVVLGGSEGGLATVGLAELLASHGYPTLALAYFGEPGLPQQLSDIPLEYFADAIKWLAAQPGVDPNRVDLLGISRGAEAALLVASSFPGQVHAVIAAGPSSVVNPPQPGPRGSAWTMNGVGVPSIQPQDFGQPTPAGSPDAMIPVERVAGRLLLVCGTDDLVWPSCGYADAIEARRGPDAVRDFVVRATGAGHAVASLVPYVSETSTVALGAEKLGGSPEADGRGRATAWQRMLDFVAAA